MADDWGKDATRRAKALMIDHTVPNAARVINCLYGGQNHFDADRKVARAVAAAAPAVKALAPAGRAFRRRVLRFLIAEAGIRQFIDVGTGLPLVGHTHEVAQGIDPKCRIVYVDDDPMVISHARALLRSAPGGEVGYVDAGLHEPDAIIKGAQEILDFGQPVAVLLLFNLAYLADTAQAADVVSALAGATVPGSYIAIYHLASDLGPELDPAIRTWNSLLPRQPLTLRSGPDVAGLVAGFEPVPPGLVPISDWRPNPGKPAPPVSAHGIVARKD